MADSPVPFRRHMFNTRKYTFATGAWLQSTDSARHTLGSRMRKKLDESLRFSKLDRIPLEAKCFLEWSRKMRSKLTNYAVLAILTASMLTGCQSAAVHRANVQDDSSDRMTVGKVQKEIRVGMSGAEVAQSLGSPNIVSTDEERREVWIYDKIATDRAYSSSSGGVNILILGYGGGAAGGSGLGGGSSAGASSTSQRTLSIPHIRYKRQGEGVKGNNLNATRPWFCH